MNALHPDILTDLVILYHAGEASQASRALLEAEAANNPQIAAALAPKPLTMPPLPADSAPAERKAMRKVRMRYVVLSAAAAWGIVLLWVLSLLIKTETGIPLAIALVPFLVLLLFFAGAAVALFFLVRALARALR